LCTSSGILQQLVWIHVHGDTDFFGESQFIDCGADGIAEAADRFCPEKDLEPVKSFGTFDWGRDNRVQRHTGIDLFADSAMNRFGGEFCEALMLGSYVNHHEMNERRIIAPFPKLDFLFEKSFEIVVTCELDGWTERG